ncbi:MAPEG family protein [Paracoccus sp. (in: a-proteobacteria)]|uniref:MAPEG family protein n=1 Tax=Paracoccus sp. TaxID=267 RepID=UPI00321F69B1
MAAETTALGLAALLQAGQLALAAAAMNRDAGTAWNAGPRDRPADFSALTGRLRRAASNHFEALILFTVAVVLVVMSDATTSLTVICAWLYLLARVLYVPAYALGWTPWRSLIWAVGFSATLAMILATLFT